MVKNGILKNFTDLTEKQHLCWSLFSIKLQAFRDSGTDSFL